LKIAYFLSSAIADPFIKMKFSMEKGFAIII